MSAPMGAGDRRRRWWGAAVCNNNDVYYVIHSQKRPHCSYDRFWNMEKVWLLVTVQSRKCLLLLMAP